MNKAGEGTHGVNIWCVRFCFVCLSDRKTATLSDVWNVFCIYLQLCTDRFGFEKCLVICVRKCVRVFVWSVCLRSLWTAIWMCWLTHPYHCNEQTVSGIPVTFAMHVTFRNSLCIYTSGVLSAQSSSWTAPTPFRPSTPACSVKWAAVHSWGDLTSGCTGRTKWFIYKQWKIVESFELRSNMYTACGELCTDLWLLSHNVLY